MFDPRVGRWLSEDPIGLEGGDTNLERYVGNDPTNATDPTGLYELDIHYYMTLHLAIAVGIPEADAQEIAWATQATDNHPRTEPVQFFSRGGPLGPLATDIRRKYHFRTGGNTTDAGSNEAAEIVDEAIKAEEGNNILMGIGLHAYEDSWSHDGYAPKPGHKDNLGKNNPDYPYNDPKFAMEMAEATYGKLEEYRNKHFPGVKPLKSFEDIADSLKRLMPANGNETIRAGRWKNQIRTDFRIDSTYDPATIKDKDKAAEFLKIAQSIKVPAL